MSNDAYLGNPNLKKVNTPVEFTEEQIVEYQKCASDPLYFMEKYIQIGERIKSKASATDRENIKLHGELKSVEDFLKVLVL